MSRAKTLIHIHTNYSFDSDIAIDRLADVLDREGFGCVAVTDHDTIDGAIQLSRAAKAKVIIGEEISTANGHLIGLFLERRVRPGMSALDTAKAIRDQGGIVLLPHPFIRMFGCALGSVSWKLEGWIDAVEIFNAQNLSPVADRKAVAFANKLNLPGFVGSDSHLSFSIAPCYQLMADVASPAGFLHSLRSAEFIVSRHPFSYFVESAIRTAKFCVGLPLGEGCGINAATHASRPPRPAARPAMDSPLRLRVD